MICSQSLQAMNTPHFAKVKDFINLQMPSGFPVRFGVCVCMCVRACACMYVYKIEWNSSMTLLSTYYSLCVRQRFLCSTSWLPKSLLVMSMATLSLFLTSRCAQSREVWTHTRLILQLDRFPWQLQRWVGLNTDTPRPVWLRLVWIQGTVSQWRRSP